MKEQIKVKMNSELKNCSSMAEIFETLGKYYDLKNCKPGLITKLAMITQLQKGVLLVGAKAKKEYL